MAMPSLPTLSLIFGLWSLLCLALYAALRWFKELFPQSGYGVGWMALVGVLWYGGSLTAVSCELDQPPGPVFYVVPSVALIVVALSGCGLLIRLATRKQLTWWHGTLFAARYLFLVQIAVFFLGIYYEVWPLLDAVTDRMGHVLGLAPYPSNPYMSLGLPILVWLYPLTAPLFEILLRSFYRAYQQTKSGSFA